MGGRRSDLCRDRRYELAGDELTDEMALGTDPEQTLSDTLGQSTVKTRFHKADWQSFDPASLDYPPCLGIRIQIDSEGGLALFHTVHTEQFHGDMPETSDATVLTTPSVSSPTSCHVLRNLNPEPDVLVRSSLRATGRVSNPARTGTITLGTRDSLRSSVMPRESSGLAGI